MRGNRNETVGRGWRGGGGLEVFAKSKNISNMDIGHGAHRTLSTFIRIYLGLSDFAFHIIPHHFKFSLNQKNQIFYN